MHDYISVSIHEFIAILQELQKKDVINKMTGSFMLYFSYLESDVKLNILYSISEFSPLKGKSNAFT